MQRANRAMRDSRWPTAILETWPALHPHSKSRPRCLAVHVGRAGPDRTERNHEHERSMKTDPLAQTDLTIREVAALGNVSTKTIRRLIDAGSLTVLRHGPRVHRIPIDSWDRYRMALFRAKYPRNVHK